MNMRLSWGLFNTLLFLIVQTNSSVLARGDKRSSPDQSQRLAILPRHPSSQGRYESYHVSLGSADAMIKRDDELSDDLRIRSIDILTGSVPIAAAAFSLELFYKAILFNALTFWEIMPPQRTLTMNMGPVHLTMDIVLDNGIPQGIPWAFVRNFARNMLAMTALGFTGTYNMLYTTDYGLSSHPGLPALSVEVRLRIEWGLQS